MLHGASPPGLVAWLLAWPPPRRCLLYRACFLAIRVFFVPALLTIQDGGECCVRSMWRQHAASVWSSEAHFVLPWCNSHSHNGTKQQRAWIMYYAYSSAVSHTMPIRWAKICYRDQLSFGAGAFVLLSPLSNNCHFCQIFGNFEYSGIFEHAFF